MTSMKPPSQEHQVRTASEQEEPAVRAVTSAWSQTRRRVLEHLAAVGVLLAPGCNEPRTSASAETPTTSSAAPNTAAAPPTTSASPVPSASATVRGKVGESCQTDTDCESNLHCRLGFDGSKFSKTGTCTKEAPIYEGRPLRVDGEAHVATLGGSPKLGVNGWTDYFARAAAEEHASVAAFARTLCQLMALGAPLELLARTQRALADEIEHTRGCLAWLQRAGGQEDALGVLPEAVADIPGANHGLDALAQALLVDVIHGGCVGETLAAEAMLERAARAQEAELAEWLERVADDEARHAALAFETVAWLVAQRPELKQVVLLELAGLPTAIRNRIEPLARECGLVEAQPTA